MHSVLTEIAELRQCTMAHAERLGAGGGDREVGFERRYWKFLTVRELSVTTLSFS